ncbi:hypothetical protein LQV05_004548 [Cryptococcus neoformans]|nr:glycerol transporter [Cryptococcus neoformans var. grubii]OXC60401.1 glycerol transporter [Cryptococcus neoformans var. grubii MW-RSA852]UOH81868.1 hypothetical protein LQV05_004548 [Cryptococcus neoformans]
MNNGNAPFTNRARNRQTRITKMQPIEDPIPPPITPQHGIKKGKLFVTDFTVTIPGSNARNVAGREPGPSKWHTLEFRLYTLTFMMVVPLMIWVPMRVSLPSHPNYYKFAHKLSPGWLFGRPVDNSDTQYRSFRDNLLPLVVLSSAYLVSSSLQARLAPSPSSRAKFIALFSAFMITLLHGTSAIKIIALLALNYHVSKFPTTPSIRKFWPWLIICGNMAILLFNEIWEGYKFESLHAQLGVLDTYKGLLPRWHVGFNITMMRLVSFGLDYLWKKPSNNTSPPTEYRKRVQTSAAEQDFSFINYMAYCLYPPLYIAGPIMTFNDFLWQLRAPASISVRAKLTYAARFLFCILTMESVLHTMYVVAIKDTAAWEGDSPAELSMIGFWNLVIVWLKLLIPWRFFRLWALLDGVDPPENMIRCVANNYSALGFWRSWHRSFNLWVVRYIYVPVGGSKNIIPATLLVFTFVALWHDLSFKLLAWGWLVSLFLVPEILARKLFAADKYGAHPLYRHVCAVGAVANILLMMTANLVGFVLGLDGTKHLLHELTSTISGWSFMLFASSCLFVAAQVMFEYREEEKRRGIDRRC